MAINVMLGELREGWVWYGEFKDRESAESPQEITEVGVSCLMQLYSHWFGR